MKEAKEMIMSVLDTKVSEHSKLVPKNHVEKGGSGKRNRQSLKGAWESAGGGG